MTEPSVAVLAERIESLCERVDEGFKDMRSIVAEHLDSDMGTHHELRASMKQLEIDVAVFKARWSIIAAGASVLISAGVSLLVTFLGR